MSSRTTILILTTMLVLSSGCEESLFNEIDSPDSSKLKVLSSFAVTLQRDGGLGTDDKPLPAGNEPTAFTLSAAALLTDGSVLTSFNRKVAISVEPGKLSADSPKEAKFVNGILKEVNVSVLQAFGPTRIWVEDTLGTSGSYVTGVSEGIIFSPATIQSVQECDRDNDPVCNGKSPNFFPSPLRDKFVKMYRSRKCGDLVVTNVTSEGFFVTDTSQGECPGAGNQEHAFGHIYVYNHSRPEGLQRGDRLWSLAGNVSEFFGLTELGFPTWEKKPCNERVEGDTWYECRGVVSNSSPDNPEDYAGGGGYVDCPPGKKCCPPDEMLLDMETPECSGSVCYEAECVPFNCKGTSCGPGQVCMKGRCEDNPYLPPPVIVEPSRVKSHWEMEKLEGALVKIENVVIQPIDSSDYDQYGQWKVMMSDGKTKITIVSRETVPSFHPEQETGACIDITGNLRFHSVPRWLIYPRDDVDIQEAKGCQ
ncbi:MAG: hypothetical protein GXP49_07800 [Deltaproteobacteria bacterium]|nr:hypothetical protein [Deltaproteobacteria bacterium]